MANSDQFYIDLAAEATETIKEFGTTFVAEQEGTTDKATLQVTEGSQRDVWGIVTNAEVSSMVDTGGFVWKAKKTLMLAADSNPVKGEKVIVDGVKFELDKLVPIKPADIVVVYLLDLGQ